MSDHHLLIEPVHAKHEKACRVSLSDDSKCFSLWVDEAQLRKVLTRLDCSEHVIERFLSSPYIVKQTIPDYAARGIGQDIFN